MLVNMALLVLGFLGLFLFFYVPLFTTNMLGNPLEPLFAIVESIPVFDAYCCFLS